jgi:hypothetical protein
LVLLVASAQAEQTARPNPTPLARPAYESGKGPVVAIDEAHKNTHTFTAPPFRGFVEILQLDGYRPRPFAQGIAGPSLNGIDVLVVSGPGGWDGPDAALSAGEVAALLEWVRGGGSLLLILDHMPGPLNGAKLTAALGVDNWHNGYAMVDIPDSLPVGNIIFWRAESFPGGEPTVAATGPGGGTGYQGADAVLAKHPITEGRSPDERVRRVATFVGSAFQPPSGAEGLLILPRRAISLTPKVLGAADVRIGAERTPVGEWLQGAVMKVGRGRVAMFGETGLFSGGPAADNRQFLLNVMHWLSHQLP